MRPLDTSEDIQDMARHRLRSMSTVERLQMALDLCDDMVDVAADGIRHRHPEYDDEQVTFALRRLYLGDDLFLESTPGAPLLRV